jgi:alkylation response protein AidB-like acyl-CoA dehydrogenase
MDLRYSDADEAFRKEVRAGSRSRTCLRPTAPPGLTAAYDMAGSAACTPASPATWPWSTRAGSRHPALVYLEEYAADAPYIGTPSSARPRRTYPIAEGTEEQRRFHLPRILRGESVWCQGSPNRRPA